MESDMRVNDLPVTDDELEQFYGSTPSQSELGLAIGTAASDFDDGELGDVVACHFEQISGLIAAGDAEAIGKYLMHLRRQRIADIASRRVYGRPGVIQASQVLI